MAYLTKIVLPSTITFFYVPSELYGQRSSEVVCSHFFMNKISSIIDAYIHRHILRGNDILYASIDKTNQKYSWLNKNQIILWPNAHNMLDNSYLI